VGIKKENPMSMLDVLQGDIRRYCAFSHTWAA
jgi:hypothetical protein